MGNKKRLIDALSLVIKLAKVVGLMVRNGKPQAEIYKKVLECIADAPTVDAVEVVHGRWKEGYVIHKYGCSCCGVRQDVISAYCPNCGAKMDGGNEDG